ncbi:unnamed protein product, partial [Polarella glacialis]
YRAAEGGLGARMTLGSSGTMVVGGMGATPRSARANNAVPFLPGYQVQSRQGTNNKNQTLGFGPALGLGGSMDSFKSTPRALIGEKSE